MGSNRVPRRRRLAPPMLRNEKRVAGTRPAIRNRRRPPRTSRRYRFVDHQMDPHPRRRRDRISPPITQRPKPPSPEQRRCLSRSPTKTSRPLRSARTSNPGKIHSRRPPRKTLPHPSQSPPRRPNPRPGQPTRPRKNPQLQRNQNHRTSILRRPRLNARFVPSHDSLNSLSLTWRGRRIVLDASGEGPNSKFPAALFFESS